MDISVEQTLWQEIRLELWSWCPARRESSKQEEEKKRKPWEFLQRTLSRPWLWSRRRRWWCPRACLRARRTSRTSYDLSQDPRSRRNRSSSHTLSPSDRGDGLLNVRMEPETPTWPLIQTQRRGEGQKRNRVEERKREKESKKKKQLYVSSWLGAVGIDPERTGFDHFLGVDLCYGPFHLVHQGSARC